MPDPFNIGKLQHGAGKLATQNPYTADTPDHAQWAEGWSEAAREAGAAQEPETATPASSSEEPEPQSEPSPAALGQAGYERILELLRNPPVGDDAPPEGALPPDGDVPEDLGDWLKAWKAPLALMTVDAATSFVKARISGSSRGRLKELYRGMSPIAMATAMQANADVVARYADERVAEAALLSTLETTVTKKATSFLLNALLLL